MNLTPSIKGQLTKVLRSSSNVIDHRESQLLWGAYRVFRKHLTEPEAKREAIAFVHGLPERERKGTISFTGCTEDSEAARTRALWLAEQLTEKGLKAQESA